MSNYDVIALGAGGGAARWDEVKEEAESAG